MSKYPRLTLEKSPEFLRLKRWLEKNKVDFETVECRVYEETIDVKFLIKNIPIRINFNPSFNRKNQNYSYTIFQAQQLNLYHGDVASTTDLHDTWPASITKTIKALNIRIKGE